MRRLGAANLARGCTPNADGERSTDSGSASAAASRHGAPRGCGGARRGEGRCGRAIAGRTDGGVEPGPTLLIYTYWFRILPSLYAYRKQGIVVLHMLTIHSNKKS